MYRWARQATRKWNCRYEGRGKWCLALVQMKLGPHARSVWVHSQGWHIQTNSDKGFPVTEPHACWQCGQTQTHIHFSGSGNRVLTGGFMVAQESKNLPVTAWLAAWESFRSPPWKEEEQSHPSHTYRETHLAQTYTKLIEKEVELPCQFLILGCQSKKQEWHQIPLDVFDLFHQKNCIGHSSLFFKHSATKQLNLPLTSALSFSIRPGFI